MREFDKDWSGNPGDNEDRNFSNNTEKWAYLTVYLRLYWTDHHQIFRLHRHMYAEDLTDINFVVA